jgi:hypothetical protein
MPTKSKVAAAKDQKRNVDNERMKNILKKHGYSGRQLRPMKLSTMDAIIKEINRKIKSGELTPQQEGVEAQKGLSQAPWKPKPPSKKKQQKPLLLINELMSSVSIEGIPNPEVIQPLAVDAIASMSQEMIVHGSNVNEVSLQRMTRATRVEAFENDKEAQRYVIRRSESDPRLLRKREVLDTPRLILKQIVKVLQSYK